MSCKTLYVIAVVAIAAVAAAQASASTGAPVNGRFQLVKVVPVACKKSASQPWMIFCRQRGHINYSGGLKGSTETDFSGWTDCKTGIGWGAGTEHFKGSVAGVGSGTLVWNLHYASGVNCKDGSLQSFSATDVVVSGTGGLAKVHGSLYRIGNNTYTGTFE
jgi:hypothetical protein